MKMLSILNKLSLVITILSIIIINRITKKKSSISTPPPDLPPDYEPSE